MKKSARSPIGMASLLLLLVGAYFSLVGQLQPAWGWRTPLGINE